MYYFNYLEIIYKRNDLEQFCSKAEIQLKKENHCNEEKESEIEE